MKNIKFIFSLMIALALGFQSCSDNFSEPPIPTAEGGTVGTGAWNDPMTAWQAYKSTSNAQYPDNAWVMGYIVGTINTSVGFTVSEKSATLEAPFSASSNLLLTWLEPEEFQALDDSEKWEYCCTVQLVSGTAARTAVNLVDHPENLYQQVCLQGTTGSTYMGAGGVRSVLDYNWGAQGKETAAQVLPEACGAFYQTFQKYSTFSDYETLGWTNNIEEGKFAGWLTTTYNKNTYMSIDASTAYRNGGPYVATLLTPIIDMEQVEEKTLAFNVGVINKNDASSLSVVALTQNEDGEWSNEVTLLESVDCAECAVGTVPEEVTVDLSSLSGEVRLGFKYTSEKGGIYTCPTYSIDNVNVGNQEAPEEVDLGNEVIATYLVNDADGWTFDDVKLNGVSYVWKWNTSGYLNGSAYSGGNKEALSYAYSPEISLEGCTGCNVTFNHAAKFQTTVKELCKFVIREVGTEEWTELEIPYWPTSGVWTFATSGQIDIHQFDGKNVEIGFKYESTTAGADTWEIKNLQVLGYK